MTPSGIEPATCRFVALTTTPPRAPDSKSVDIYGLKGTNVNSAVVRAECKHFEFSSSWNKAKLEFGRVGMPHLKVNLRVRPKATRAGLG